VDRDRNKVQQKDTPFVMVVMDQEEQLAGSVMDRVQIEKSR